MISMDSGSLSVSLYLVTLVTVVVVVLLQFCVPVHSSKEPPLISPSIPYLGHILGLIQHGVRYYQMTRYQVGPSGTRRPLE